MKISTLTIKNIIKEELDSVIDEFKMPDMIPPPVSMGLKKVNFNSAILKQGEDLLNNVDLKGLASFLKQNFPMETLKESIEKNLPRRKRTAGEIITDSVKTMKADRMWQLDFDQNIQELIQISKEKPNQKELIDEWVKIFITEKSKPWHVANKETIKEFVRNNFQQLLGFFGDEIAKESLIGIGIMLFGAAVSFGLFSGLIIGLNELQSIWSGTLPVFFVSLVVGTVYTMANLNSAEG